jgi:hypothetical protein
MSDETTDSGDDQIPTRTCGMMEAYQYLASIDQDYPARLASLEDQTNQYIARALADTSGTAVARGAGPVRIPVVVHVVSIDNDSNISDQQVQSQIDVLNADYRKRNSDAGHTPDCWASLVADVGIEFFLATQDPDGNATNGITRTTTTVATFTEANEIKTAATGGHDPWPTDKYLNIWTCKRLRSRSGLNLLGYAQFPSGAAATDGVVIRSSAFGNCGTAAAPYNLGRTTTHEVGHWLNLRHIWGDAPCGDDFVSDTPPAAGPNYGQPSFPHVTGCALGASADNGPNGDMFMNYMDYVNDDTMVMFTSGQALRMAATLSGPRTSFNP